jgi:hypothetical protein
VSTFLERRRRIKKRVIVIWCIETCVCVILTKVVSVFEQGMVVGARHTGLSKELQRCCFFHAEQFPVYIKNGPPPKGQPANWTQLWEAMESTWASITCEMLSTSCRIHVQTDWGCSEGKRGCNSILRRCS